MRRHGAIEGRRHTLREHIRRRIISTARQRVERSVIDEIRRYRELYEEIRREQRRRDAERRQFVIFEFFRRIAIEFYEDVINRVREFIRSYTAFYDLITATQLLRRERASILFTVERRLFFHRDKTVVRIRDEQLLSLPEDVQNAVVDAIMKAAEGKYTPTELMAEYPQIVYFLQRYILYFQRYPCKSARWAFKVTPVTLHFFMGKSVTYYVMRWIRVDQMRSDHLLEMARSVDLYFFMQARKPYWDILNTITFANPGTTNPTDRVVIARDDKREKLVEVPLRRAVLQPHHVRRAFSKAIGMPEAYDASSHCSIYAIPTRKPKSAKLYEAGASRELIAKRKRRRITEITWELGLRG